MTEVLFGIIVFLTQLVEAVTGFGSTVMALPFSAALIGIRASVSVLAATTFAMCLVIAVLERKHIQWKIYLQMVVFVLIGLPFGMYVFSVLPEDPLRRLLGVIVTFIAAYRLIVRFVTIYKQNLFKQNPAEAEEFNIGKHHSLWLFAGGVVHGMFASGGPFIVIYAAKALKSKTHFRATMCMLWVTLNSAVILRDVYSGMYTPYVLRLLIIGLVCSAASIYVGNKLHKKLNAESFTVFVYVVLLISGIFTLFS